MKKYLCFILLGLSFTVWGAVTSVVTLPGGSNTQVQFNNKGFFGGDADFTFSTTTNKVTVSSAAITFIDGSTASVCLVIFADGTSMNTAAISSGGGSTLQVKRGGVEVSSPTNSIDFDSAQFGITQSPSGEANFALSPASVTLLGQSVLSLSSATATYVQHSSAVANFLTISSAAATYPLTSYVLSGSSAIATYLQKTAGASTYLEMSSATVTYLQLSSATANFQPLDADLTDLADGSLTGSKVGDGVPANHIAAGSLDSDVIASSIAVSAVGVSQINATGTPGIDTFLRGDGAWQTATGAASGSGTTILMKEGAVEKLFTSTAVFNVDQFLINDVSGEGTIDLDESSVTLQGQSVLSFSSATATYLQLSSATENFLTLSSAPATYLQLSSATANFIQNRDTLQDGASFYVKSGIVYDGIVAQNGSIGDGITATVYYDDTVANRAYVATINDLFGPTANDFSLFVSSHIISGEGTVRNVISWKYGGGSDVDLGLGLGTDKLFRLPGGTSSKGISAAVLSGQAMGFGDSDNAEYVALQAPLTLTADSHLVLPDPAGVSANDVMSVSAVAGSSITLAFSGAYVQKSTQVFQATYDLATIYDNDSDLWLIDTATAAFPNGIHVLEIYVDATVADPTTELNANLMYCDSVFGGAFPGGGATLIKAIDTTAGNFADAAANIIVPVGKSIYIDMDADPTDANVQYHIRIHYSLMGD